MCERILYSRGSAGEEKGSAGNGQNGRKAAGTGADGYAAAGKASRDTQPKESRSAGRSSSRRKPGRRKSFRQNKTGSLYYLPHLASVAAMLAISVTMGWHYDKSGAVSLTEVTGNYFTETTEILKAANIPEGTVADSLDFIGILEKIEKLPYVRQAFIARTADGRLRVRVEERSPVALLSAGERWVYVDKEGIRLPAMPGKSVDVPLLHATSPALRRDTLTGEAFDAVSRFLHALRSDPAINLTISEIAWSETEGIVALSHDDAKRLVFGAGNFESRLNKWRRFYTEKMLRDGVRNMNRIDLRFRGQIVTRE